MIRYTIFGLLGVIAIVTLLTAIFSGFVNVSSQWDSIKRITGNVNWWWVLAASMANLGTFFFKKPSSSGFCPERLARNQLFGRMWGWWFFDK